MIVGAKVNLWVARIVMETKMTNWVDRIVMDD